MIKLNLEYRFKTTPEILWELIVDPVYYKMWSKAFHEGSDFIGNWEKGSKMKFVSKNEDGTHSGIVSEVEACDWPKFISIKHLGIIADDIEDYESEEAKAWAPAYENYFLSLESSEITLLRVEMDIEESFVDEFKIYWDKAYGRFNEILEDIKGKAFKIALREHSTLSPESLWVCLTNPEYVMKWNHASDDWYCPSAENSLEVGGTFHYQMAARDESVSFDFWGTYQEIVPDKRLAFVLGDGRMVEIDIVKAPDGCVVLERFEAEEQNSLALQRQGWGLILKNLVTCKIAN